MNVSSISISSSPQPSWSTANAQEKEADFLTLRLLNKRARIRISPQPLDLSVHDGRGNYFIVSNLKGWFAAIARNAHGEHQLRFSPLSELRESILSSKADGEDDLAPKRFLPVAGAPIYLALALNDERLAVGFSDGSISIYNTAILFSAGEGNIEALRTFPPGPPGPLRQIIGNPGDLSELVAVRRDARSGADGLAVEIFNVNQLQSVGGWRTGSTPGSIPTSISWSAKGKQLAIGLQSGDIITYSPTDTSSVKLHVPKPPSAGDSSVISVTWLSNQAFYGIYAPPGNFSPEAPQKHILTLFDPKTNSATQTQLETPYYASPALRPPGAFMVVMRNWNPTKLLIFFGDSTSSDIGLVGSVAENDTSETWCNLTLEETSTPSVPLDKDAEDTVPLAMDMDLTTGHGDQARVSSPVLYLFASDGTLQAWFLSNERGGPYPLIALSSSASSTSQTAQPDDKATTGASAYSQPSSAVGSARMETLSGQASSKGFATPGIVSSSQSTPSSTAFGQTSSPAFGSPGFGQHASTSTFGQTSAFAQQPSMSSFGSSTQPSFGQSSSSGFGAFASSSPSKFGSTNLGFGSSPPPAGPSSAATGFVAANAGSPEAEMSEADEGQADNLGGLSLGGAGEDNKSQDKPVNSIFGSFSPNASQERATTSGFGGSSSSFGAFGNVSGSGFLRPASGFGAFLKPAETPDKPAYPSSDTHLKPSPAFGASSFGSSGFGPAKPQSAFGQPAFGQSSFSSASSFGSPSPAPSNTGTSSSGGFSAFAGATKGFSSFAQGAPTGFGQQAQSLQNIPSEAPSIAMATSSEDATKGSGPFASGEQKSAPSFGSSPSSSTVFGSAKPQSSPFGGGTQNSANASGASSEKIPSGGPGQGSRVLGTRHIDPSSAQDQKAGTFSTPIARGQSLTSSPEGSPSLGRKPVIPEDDSFADEESISSLKPIAQSTTPFGTPAQSVFKATGPVPLTGAFGGLTATPSAFKPAEGFGAFGASAKTPTSSPFANPKPATVNAFSTPVKPVSAFGAGGSGPSSAFQTPTVGSTTPKFGTPSTPGVSNVFGKSSLGIPATPSPSSTTPLSTPVGNAFSAYSGTGGFSAFAKVGKPSSFSELLKQKDEDARSTSDQKDSISAGKDKKEEELSFVTISKPEELDQDNLPPTPSTHGTFDEDDQNLGDELEGEEHDPDDADSFISESFSEGSSGEPEEQEEEVEEDGEEREVEEEEDGSESEADEEQAPIVEAPSRSKTGSPAANSLSSTKESGESTPRSGPSDVKTEAEFPSHSPVQPVKATSDSAKPVPVFSKPDAITSRNSTLPAPIVTQLPDDDKKSTASLKSPPPQFAKQVGSGIPTLFGKQMGATERPSSGTDKSAPSSSGGPTDPTGESVCHLPSQSALPRPASSVRQESTTPPGSPRQPEDEQSFPAPQAMGPLGLGRPASRPARSSPLASTPISGEDSKAIPNDPTSQSTPLFPKARPASPKTIFGQIPSATGQQNPVPSNLVRIDDRQRQLLTPPATGISALPLRPPQLGATVQASIPSPLPFKPPTFGGVQAPSSAAGNAPFIMPASVPPGSNDKPGPGPSTIGMTNFRTPGAPAQQVSKPTAQQIPKQATFESSMQKECQTLFMSMMEEFDQLMSLSNIATSLRISMSKPSGCVQSKGDLKDKMRWTFGDIGTFGRLIKSLEGDILAVYGLKDELVPLIREVESNLLKAETRKEEIVRFSKAKADPEFAKMLKARTLDPDASEIQSQLRKQIRLVNDRVEQLEMHLKSCKKKLEERRKGKSSIKPPSLDTINRIYRNIDLSLESQTQQIETLTSRIAKLNVDEFDTALHGTPSPRRKSVRKVDIPPDSNSSDGGEVPSRPQVTPSIAASTAAALNAERSALRLKNALSNARKTPLLNTQAAESARRVPTLDKLSGELPSELNLSLDSLGALEQDATGDSQRRPTRHSAHAKSVKLGKTHAQVPPSITTFDWGPLPKAKPMATLPFDIRPETF